MFIIVMFLLYVTADMVNIWILTTIHDLFFLTHTHTHTHTHIYIYLFIRLTTAHDQIEKLLCFCKNFSITLKDILYFAIVKGDEVSLQRALNIVHMNSHEYVAVLFYASWCPFSRTFRPSFSILSSLYPSIPHFAIEESAVRPRFVYHYFP